MSEDTELGATDALIWMALDAAVARRPIAADDYQQLRAIAKSDQLAALASGIFVWLVDLDMDSTRSAIVDLDSHLSASDSAPLADASRVLRWNLVSWLGLNGEGGELDQYVDESLLARVSAGSAPPWTSIRMMLVEQLTDAGRRSEAHSLIDRYLEEPVAPEPSDPLDPVSRIIELVRGDQAWHPRLAESLHEAVDGGYLPG